MHSHGDGYCREDFSSHANTHEVRVTRYDVKLWPHINNRTLKTEVTCHLHAVAEATKVCMDVMNFDSIVVKQNGQECKHETSKASDIGSRLTIHLVTPLHKDSNSTIEITSTTSNAKSLTWGDFVFTQNEPIYCRSLFPCQDTPSSKSTFDIEVHLDEADSKLSVFATGLRKGTTNHFTMDIPIPTYLFAFLIGNFEHRKLNHRIGVVAEPQ
jgi:leukotriene-A4 hydrolase